MKWEWILSTEESQIVFPFYQEKNAKICGGSSFSPVFALYLIQVTQWFHLLLFREDQVTKKPFIRCIITANTWQVGIIHRTERFKYFKLVNFRMIFYWWEKLNQVN
jgi:hypothetical protein